MDKLHAFYTSKAWRDLSFNLKIARDGKCERCGSFVKDMKYLIGHHTIELTEDNVDNPKVSLNPELIEIICHDCHNKEHRRFGSTKHVYVVWGSPMSGKSTMVQEMARFGDIVLNIDMLWQAVTMQPANRKPDNVRFNVFALRDNLLDQIKTRYGQWYDAYVVGGYPDKYERERLAESLGAEMIYCESTKQECLARLDKSGMLKQQEQYVNDWWERYERGL